MLSPPRHEPDRVLVTGASGFVGSNLTRALIQRGYRVTVLTRRDSRLWRLEDVRSSFEQLHADLNDAYEIRTAVQKAKPVVIFHTAAANVAGGQLTAPELDMMRTNFLGTVNLIRACDELEYRCFVNTGSSSEYGPKTEPMRETDMPEPRDGYGVAKCAATMYASAVGRRAHRPILTLRLFSPFGPFDDPRRLIPTAIAAALAGREIPLARPEIGRDYVYIDDVVQAYLSATELAHELSGGVINVGSGREATLNEVIETILSETQSASLPNWGAFPNSSQDNPRWQADITKAAQCLGWRPRVSFREGIQRTVAWFREHAADHLNS